MNVNCEDNFEIFKNVEIIKLKWLINNTNPLSWIHISDTI